MKNLNDYFEKAIKELDAIGIPYGRIDYVTVNTRAKSRWGQCKYVAGRYEINISDRLLQDDVSDIALMNTIIHEILHTCKNCMNHGKEWKKFADFINKCYPKYNITRCTSSEEKGIKEEPKKVKYKYMLVCENCGEKSYYIRKPKGAKDNFKGWICSECKHESLKMIEL